MEALNQALNRALGQAFIAWNSRAAIQGRWFQPAPVYLLSKPSYFVRRPNAVNLVRVSTNTWKSANNTGNDYQNWRVY